MGKELFEKIYNPESFKEIGQQVLSDLSAHILNTTKENNKKTIQWNSPENELDFWNDFLENGNQDDFFREILKRTTHTHNPKYIGHQVAAPAPITALTGMIASMLNNGMAVYEMGMSPTAMERIVTDKLAEKMGWSTDSRGVLTSGGTLANLTALLTARNVKAPGDVWNEGQAKPLGIMVSEEAHYCVERAAKIMGFGEKGIVKVPVNNNYSIDISKLDSCYDQAKANGLEVFAIVGSTPSTATGAYDDLEALAAFSKKKKLWLHVDGAHGGAAIYSKKYCHLLKGIENADSVVIDGHKMLLMPTITTALLFRESQNSHKTFSQKADYLLNDTEDEDWYNGGKRTFECTKSMMSLHWYVLLKYYGEKVFDEYVTRQYDLTKSFEKLLRQHPHFELAVSPQSNIACFRYVDNITPNETLNEINAKIRAELLDEGEFYLVQTKLRGIHYLRTTLMNPFTTMDHLKVLLEKVVHLANSLS